MTEIEELCGRLIRLRRWRGALIAAVVPAQFAVIALSRNGVWMIPACLAILTVYTGAWAWLQSRVRSAEKLMARSGWSICPHCRFDLSGHGDAGACPECGKRYTLESLARAWDTLE